MADPFLYERVYNYVLEEIRTERLQAGDRVPSEKDLAERFGVSRITTKRALHMLADAGVLDRHRGKGSFVAENYPPLDQLIASAPAHHPAATALAAAEVGTPRPTVSCIALVLPDASDAYGLELLNAIEERAAEHGYHLIVRRTRDSQEVEEQAIQALTSDGIADGLIVFPVHGDYYNAGLVRMVFDRSPLVLVDRYLRGIPACSVYIDNHAAAYGLTCHLLDQGHQQVAFVSPPVANTSSIEERSNGFEAALRDRGYAADAGLRFTDFQSTLPGSDSEQEAADRAAIRAFVEREPAVTGFVACEYNIALLLREVFEELDEEAAGTADAAAGVAPAGDSLDSRSEQGRSDQRRGDHAGLPLAPRASEQGRSEQGRSEHADLPLAQRGGEQARAGQGRGGQGRVIACFDSPHTRWARPFVHIKQDQRQMGRRAVDLLLAQLAGEDVPLQTVVPYTLIDPFAR